jgi:catechol 2,3-dioxygenase-like lactoylglutathione lyase family enzyme
MAFESSAVEATLIRVVADAGVARDFYRDVLGARVEREYGGTSVVLRFAGLWLLVVTGGGPSEDKPTVTLAPPDDPDRVSQLLTLRVPDCQAAYEDLRGRGARFLTPPVDHSAEVRCFLRDPDGYLVELSEYRG